MSSAIATHSFAANVLRVGARNAGRTAPSRANRMTVRLLSPLSVRVTQLQIQTLSTV